MSHSQNSIELLNILDRITTEDAVQAFLDNFDYLNQQRQRSSGIQFFSNLFKDNQLDKQLANVANDLIERLQTLQSSKKERFIDSKPEFIQLIKLAFKEVQKLKFMDGKMNVSSTPMLFSAGPIYATMEWQPKSIETFKKALLTALTALNASFDKPDAEIFDLIRSIQTFKLKPVLVKDMGPGIGQSHIYQALFTKEERQEYIEQLTLTI